MGFNDAGYDWWYYFIMPWLAGVVGWGTNVLALQMTFYPIEFFGIPWFRMKDQPWGLFGWQGIVPTKTEKIATVCVDLTTTKLIRVRDVFDRLDPIKFSEVMEEGMLLLMDSIMTEVAAIYMPQVWNNLPQEVRDELVVAMNGASLQFMTDFMKDMQEHVEDILDIKHMAVTACVENKALMNMVFLECGQQEFTFIRRSGFYFGFLFGSIQMVVYFFYDGSWILPVAGFIVGWITNWLALKVIFRPLEPKHVCGYKLQGIFLKRQKEVAETFARISAVEIIHTKAIWEAILNGPLSKNFDAMLRAHSIVFTEKLIGGLKPLAVAAMGATRFAQMKEDIATKVIQKLPSIVDQSYEYVTEAFDIENTMREKMEALPPAEFEAVLHPAFEEDEILLIAVGGMLGLCVGLFELLIFSFA